MLAIIVVLLSVAADPNTLAGVEARFCPHLGLRTLYVTAARRLP